MATKPHKVLLWSLNGLAPYIFKLS